MPVVLQFVQPDLELLSQKRLGMFGAVAEHIVHAEELWLVVHDDTCVRRNRHLAVCKCIKSIYGLVRRHIVRKMDEDVRIACSQVLYLLYLDLALVLCLEDRIDDRVGGLSIWNFHDGKCVLVYLLDLCTYLHGAASLSLHIFRAVCESAGWEVRIYLEILALKNGDGSVDELVEVVRENLGGKTYGNTFRSLCEQKREFDRKLHRFLVTSVIRSHPVGCLRIEHHFLGKFAQTCLDITWCGIGVTCKDVTPVTLTVDQIVLLSQLYECAQDGLVAVRVELHRLSHDIGYLGISSVVDAPHRMQHTSLYRLHTIHDMRHGPVQDHI